MKEEKFIITFDTTTMAFKMEDRCKKHGKRGRIIPLPEEIDAGCGLAWYTDDFQEEEWKDFLAKQEIEYDQMRSIVF